VLHCVTGQHIALLLDVLLTKHCVTGQHIALLLDVLLTKHCVTGQHTALLLHVLLTTALLPSILPINCTLSSFFLGGVEPNSLLYLPWMISVEQLVECLAVETKLLRENLSQCRLVHHKSQMLLPGPPWCESGG
jgi:hypothetical protein